MASLGFSILLYVRDDSTVVQDLSLDSRDAMEKELLDDAKILIGGKYGMDMTDHTGQRSKRYAYGINPRLTPANHTIRTALGNLANHVDFIRGNTHQTPEDLIRYKEAKERWKVEEPDSTGSGAAEPGPAWTSTSSKRTRY